jgi:hypothetical protein
MAGPDPEKDGFCAYTREDLVALAEKKFGKSVNGLRNLPSLGRAKFPTLAGVAISRWFDRFLRSWAVGRGA